MLLIWTCFQCASCTICAQANPATTKAHEPLKPIAVVVPWHHVQIDMLQMRTTSRGMKYVVVLVDLFFCLVVAKALATKTAAEVGLFLLEQILDKGAHSLVAASVPPSLFSLQLSASFVAQSLSLFVSSSFCLRSLLLFLFWLHLFSQPQLSCL